MGYSRWSDQAFQSRQGHRRATNTTAFAYDQHVRQTGQRRVHDEMNPYQVVRESRDSDAHPDSLAIAVVFDVTGSMGRVPRVLQTKLGALMRTLLEKGYVTHPQILFGAVGDAYTDAVPLQIGQFESGLEMDDDLGKLYLEGGGGGQVHETYELVHYFFARHTAIDCFEKRGRKGYLFTIGDEKPYPIVRRQHVRHHIGDGLETDLPIEIVLAALQMRYEYFHIVPTNTAHGRSDDVQTRWRDLLQERVLILDDETAVCETIALAIGLCEGAIGDVFAGAADLSAAGYDREAVARAADALTSFAGSRAAATRLLPGR